MSRDNEDSLLALVQTLKLSKVAICFETGWKIRKDKVTQVKFLAEMVRTATSAFFSFTSARLLGISANVF